MDGEYTVAQLLEMSVPTSLLGVWSGGHASNNTIPRHIDQFTNLFGLHFDSVRGPLPTQSLAALTSLEALQMEEVTNGPVDFPPFDAMPKLKEITLREVDGGMRGDWPNFELHQGLYHVDFSNADIRSPPPSSLFSLPKLKEIDLQNNPSAVPWSLPSALSPGLNRLAVQQCNITGTIPTVFGALRALTSLNAGGNALEGTIPPQIGKATALISLLLGDNRLDGPLPSQLGLLSKLTLLNLVENEIRGTVPSYVGWMTSLLRLDVDTNHLYGSLPTEFGLLTALTFLSLANNDFSGSLLAISRQLNALESVRVEYNNFEGKVEGQTEVWTMNCDFSGLAMRGCKSRIPPCDNSTLHFLLSRGDPDNGEGRLCLGPEKYLAIPCSVVFLGVFGVVVWSIRKAKGPFPALLGWAAIVGVVAVVDFAATLTTFVALMDYSLETQLSCGLPLALLQLQGLFGCTWCPATAYLRPWDVFVTVVSPQLLVEVPWRALHRNMPANSDPMQNLPGTRKRYTLCAFTRTVANIKILACLAVIPLQAVLARDSRTALLALCLGVVCLCIAVGVRWRLARKWRSE